MFWHDGYWLFLNISWTKYWKSGGVRMKILKYLLILILFLIVVTIGVLFFSGKIIESKLNTKETQIENFKFSLGKREITFDNISINGNKMGPDVQQ